MWLYAAVLVVVGLSWGAAPRVAQGQEPSAETAPLPSAAADDSGITVDRLEQLVAEAEQNAALDEETRKQVAGVYRSALAELQAAAAHASRGESFAADAQSAMARAEEAKQKIEELKSKEPTIESDGSLTDLEQQLAKLELTLANRKKARTAAAAESQTRVQRRKEIRARTVALEELLTDLQNEKTQLSASEPGPVTMARRALVEARTKSAEEELPTLERELLKYDAEEAAGLVRLGVDLTTLQAGFTEKRIAMLQERVNSEREADAARSVREARESAVAVDPMLRSLAERNQQLTETSKEVVDSLALAKSELKATTAVLDEFRQQYERTHEKEEQVGLTSSIGALLRKQRTALPEVSELRAAVASRQSIINEIQYELFEYEEERDDLAALGSRSNGSLADSDTQDAAGAEFEAASQELLEKKREYLDTLIYNTSQYFDTLVDLNITDLRLVKLAEEYERFIDERVLWIRSGRLLSLDEGLDESDAWLLSPLKWSELTKRLLADTSRNWALYCTAGLVFVVLLARRRNHRRAVLDAGVQAQKSTCRSLEPTARALALTAVVAMLWPLVGVFLGWRLSEAALGSPFTRAVGVGLLYLSALAAPLEFFRQVCRPRGLGEAHFGWNEGNTKQIRKELRWFLTMGGPFAFVTATIMASDPSHSRGALERCSFFVGMVIVATLIYRLLRPSGVVREYLKHRQEGWINRLRHFWITACVGLPLLLATLAIWGYYYTAKVLAWRLFVTCFFAMVLVVSRAVLFRMLLLRRRFLSMEQARKRAADQQEAGSNIAGIVAEDPTSDITAQNVQAMRLLSTGLYAVSLVGMWLIWSPVLPALSRLDEYVLWTTGSDYPVAAAPADSAESEPSLTPGAPMPMPATARGYQAGDKTVVAVSDLAAAILVAFVTFVLARNGPGLLEMSVLRQLPFDASVRYAITTLVSYIIVLVGVIIAFSTIGLRWSQIQWLVTALTFGLAFGLQEMFANFVSGLIILIERPIRVGDVVTIDDVTGVVSRIRIRATSITNWDRKDYIIPNKEFITGRVLNWTLSDQINRIVVNVGVAYGADTDRARELLLEVANKHPLILKDPPTIVTFEGFGDSSLSFVMRTYLPSLENRLEVIHHLHSEIDKAFRREGIEIAFPQLDLHVRSAPPTLSPVPPAAEAADGPADGDAADSGEGKPGDAT
ncbi:Mechanosensitive channel MscK precursor [Pseudobythopirellula maris]|uniref:Mechanosensitive channel MscK n=1 Tax=Pseudobythopirellula maris TaxID=2527991 RepID=A0A5C5ZSU9_9BACT|nr:mechanosensitive ion channel domain-containing protein [Pseudobythopirellula maris]TWT90138.1 Mechanosensitive channel MscK precursor [Pseudobythopirellula maris]